MPEETPCSLDNCGETDEFSAETGRCIFHCDKHDWYKTTATGARDWSESKEKVELFWKAIREQISAVKKREPDDRFYNFAGYVFPHFWNRNFHKSYSSAGKVDFDGDVQCVGATFLAPARFSDMHFKSLARFGGSVFEEGAEFSFVEFLHEADFSQCKFLGDTSFRVIFHKKVHFHDAFFPRDKRTIFSPYALGDSYSVFRDITYFRNIDFPRTFIFSHIDFTNVNFSGSNIEEAQFSECSFEIVNGRIRLFDEKGVYREGGHNVIPASYFGIMENLYRQFKRNFENKRDWRRAGEFFIGEMEMRRIRLRLEANEYGIPREEYLKEPPRLLSCYWWKNLRKNPPRVDRWHWWELAIERLLLEVFRAISFYGQRETRALLFIVGFVLIGAFALWITGDMLNILQSILTSIRAVSFQQENQFEKFSLVSQWIVTVLRVGSAVLLPLFALALRNRFKR